MYKRTALTNAILLALALPTAASALEALEKSEYELVIVLRTLSDTDPAEFSREARKLRLNIPIVLLAFHHGELKAERESLVDAYDNARRRERP